MPGPSRRLLILGGTGDGAEIAAAACVRFGDRLEVISALAGRTEAPARPPGRVRIGGFGGADGLAAYLREESIDLVIDATHPFATNISENARIASVEAGTPRLVFDRAPWRPEAGDRWHTVPDIGAAADAVRDLGRRIFLTVGERALAHFAPVQDLWFLIRLIDPPRAPIPLPHRALTLGRGPFEVADERRLLQDHEIDLIVTRASGGEGTQAKLIAARELGLPVVMIARPFAPEGESVSDVAGALDWIARQLGEPLAP